MISMHAHDAASSWAPVFQALAGGLVAGAASVLTIWLGLKAAAKDRAAQWDRERTAAADERALAKRDARETELRQAVRTVRTSHFRAITAANDLLNAIRQAEHDPEHHAQDADAHLDVTDHPRSDQWKEAYIAAREEAENLRAVSRSSATRSAVDALVEKAREMHGVTEKAPPNLVDTIHSLSSDLSDLIRTVSDAVDKENEAP